MEQLPCPACAASLPVDQWLDSIDVCWPYRRFVQTVCPRCAARATLIPGYEVLTIGWVDSAKDPALVPSGRVEPEDYDVNWSSAGVRITIGDRRWTAKAADDDLVS